MYIVTFYSFKGGVGRTLALANVGSQLARTGRRVLLVDFDLEAPGLHTFKLLKSRERTNGLVDYISEYIGTLASPDVRNYIYEVKDVGQNDDRLWIMPAGTDDTGYSKKLSAINWQYLYKNNDGFLMFEDLKAQWKSTYDFDYVLIDSRTGHTDIGGICTRQLPDAVVTLFFPNEQNLNGLKPIISAIRNDDAKREKTTQLHFVMSNVPDLDDEDEILADLEKKFQEELGYKRLSSIIYRYDSLSLLQQSLFVIERPKSRLAKEYNKLMQEVTEVNIEDREGVMQSLAKMRKRLWVHGQSIEGEEDRIDKIAKHHSRDGELLYLLAIESKRMGRSKKSEMLLTRSIDCGYCSPEALLIQAENLQKDGQDKEAMNLLWRVFDYPNLDREQLGSGVDIVRRIEPQKLLELVETTAFKSLSVDGVLWICRELCWCKQGLQASVELLIKYYNDQNITVLIANNVKQQLLLSLIGLGKFEDAIKLFGKSRPNVSDFTSISDSFNYAMAEWGLRNEIPKDVFARVIELHQTTKHFNSANYLQCLAVAYWAIGEHNKATVSLQAAEEMISGALNEEFSCWRYLTVTPEDFRKDCNLIKRLIIGDDIKPLFWNNVAYHRN